MSSLLKLCSLSLCQQKLQRAPKRKNVLRWDFFFSKSYFFLEVVEHACSITSLQMGESLSGIAKDMDIYSFKLPLGVVAGIAPFNFPAMIPLWMFPVGIVCGNTYIMKVKQQKPLGVTYYFCSFKNRAACFVEIEDFWKAVVF